MTSAYAADIVTWRYPAPYDCYDMTGASPAFLISQEGGFYALVEGQELIGFRSFGEDGRVPGGDYDSSALDTGGGLRPDLTGKGLGREAIGTGLAFGRREFAPAGVPHDGRVLQRAGAPRGPLRSASPRAAASSPSSTPAATSSSSAPSPAPLRHDHGRSDGVKAAPRRAWGAGPSAGALVTR